MFLVAGRTIIERAKIKADFVLSKFAHKKLSFATNIIFVKIKNFIYYRVVDAPNS